MWFNSSTQPTSISRWPAENSRPVVSVSKTISRTIPVSVQSLRFASRPATPPGEILKVRPTRAIRPLQRVDQLLPSRDLEHGASDIRVGHEEDRRVTDVVDRAHP